jgi:hypothetical protein
VIELQEKVKIQRLLKDARDCIDSIDESCEYGKSMKKRFIPAWYQCKGVVSFVFRHPMTLVHDCNTAINYLQIAISFEPEPDSYVYLLKALDQKIDALINDKRKKDSIDEAIRYCDVLKKIRIPDGHKEFVDKFSEKLKELSKPKEPEKKKETPPVICCVVSCPPASKKTEDAKTG